MVDLPAPVVQFLCSTLIQGRSLVYLQISQQGQLLASGGNLSGYGLEGLTPGQPIADQLFFLEGLLPLAEASVHIPLLQIQNHQGIELHLFKQNQLDWVILLEASTDIDQQILMQQKVNDLSLLRHQQAQQLSQQLQQIEMAEIDALPPHQANTSDFLGHLPFGEQRNRTILTLKFLRLADQAPSQIPVNLLKQLDAYLTLVTPLIQDAGGIIYQQMGCAITALFGLLPSSQPASRQGFDASLRIMTAIQTYQDPFVPSDPLSVGQLLTSGTIDLGMIQVGYSKRLTVVGSPLDLAIQINPVLDQDGLIIDQATFDQLQQLHPLFERTTTSYYPKQNCPSLYAYCAAP